MEIRTLKISGADAIRLLDEHRSRYTATGEYPFLIGDSEDLERVEENASFNEKDSNAIMQDSFEINLAQLVSEYRRETEESKYAEESIGNWPDTPPQHGSIEVHKDTLIRKLKQEVFLGFARIEEPWQLPAVVKCGDWNACPQTEVHCAFHRYWQERFGAEIMSISGDVVECTVRKPPNDRSLSMELAWSQYAYCEDIVTQGCGSISMLAATLLKSPYWYFWWD